jgi:uncharacterized membrane protein YfcA
MTLTWTTCAEHFTGAGTLSGPITVFLPIISLRARILWPEIVRWWRAGGAVLTLQAGLGLAALLCFVLAASDQQPAQLMMAAISLAALLASVAGFAFSAICGAMLFHLSADPVHVVQIMMVCSIANQAAMSWGVPHDTDWRWLSRFLAAGVPGVSVGAWLLVHVDRSIYIDSLGAILVAYSGYMLFCRPLTIVRPLPAVDVAVACISGVTGGLAGFPSSALTVWCSMKGWDKTRQRGIYQPFIFLMQVVGLLMVTFFRSGGPIVAFNARDLLFIPASLLGSSIGFNLCRRLSDLQFNRCVNLSLLASGLSFLI